MRRGPGPVIVPLVVASLVLEALAWGDWLIEGGSPFGVPYPVVLAALLVINLGLTSALPGYKRSMVRLFQKYVMNPPVRLLLRLCIPVGWVLLETTGRRSGRPRSVPVGNGLVAGTLWVVAEHGDQAGYVRNLRANPRVRVLMRSSGLRMRWVTGTAVVLDHDDAYARQRFIVGWRHPVRALNAMVVRVLGTRLRTVRVDLDPRREPPVTKPRSRPRGSVLVTSDARRRRGAAEGVEVDAHR